MKLTTKLKNTINNLLQIFNLYLQKRHAGVDPTEQLLTTFKYFNIDYVIDVGANVGQFASELLQNQFKGHIISFEPLTDAHYQLNKYSKKYSNWEVYERAAIGNDEGKIQINISGNSVSSSILDISNVHLNASNSSAYIGAEETKITSIDSVFDNGNSLIGKSAFLKIDTQGFEWEVLLGAKNSIKNVKGILCELSFDNLYNGQKNWLEIVDYLKECGFVLWSIQYGLTDKNSGRTLQCDAIFYKKNA